MHRGYAERDPEHSRIDAHLVSARQNRRPKAEPEDAGRIDRRQRFDERDAGGAEHGAKHPTARGEHGAFRHHLSDHASAAGADRESHCHLALTGGAAREHQVGHIGADDEQHGRHGSEQDTERRTQLLDDLILEDQHVEPRPGERWRVGRARRADRVAEESGFFHRRRL